VAQRHARRVAHVHCKDVRAGVLRDVLARDATFNAPCSMACSPCPATARSITARFSHRWRRPVFGLAGRRGGAGSGEGASVDLRAHGLREPAQATQAAGLAMVSLLRLIGAASSDPCTRPTSRRTRARDLAWVVDLNVRPAQTLRGSLRCARHGLARRGARRSEVRAVVSVHRRARTPRSSSRARVGQGDLLRKARGSRISPRRCVRPASSRKRTSVPRRLQPRFDPTHAALHDAIRAGEIGRPKCSCCRAAIRRSRRRTTWPRCRTASSTTR
jgi:hypothetical protein